SRGRGGLTSSSLVIRRTVLSGWSWPGRAPGVRTRRVFCRCCCRCWRIREKLGDGFLAVELDPADRNPAGPLPRPHSVLTGDLVDQPGTPTRAALDRVLDLIRTTLLGETP
ncbi:MAG TPA: hypothetical protein VHN80_00835, partial [Kineosporiaceae bacterium]|nr:hypothetical protein [Kineosporiaceae bacterium]